MLTSLVDNHGDHPVNAIRLAACLNPNVETMAKLKDLAPVDVSMTPYACSMYLKTLCLDFKY